MDTIIKEEKIKKLYSLLDKVKRLEHMASIINYDISTQSPLKGMAESNQDLVEISSQIFKIKTSKEFIDLVVELHDNFDLLDIYEKKLISELYNNYLDSKNVSAKLQRQISEKQANNFQTWLEAKEASDYKKFEPVLKNTLNTYKKLATLSEKPKLATPLDDIMDDYEHGMTVEMLDKFFARIKERLVPFIQKIRTADLSHKSVELFTRTVPEWKQKEFAKYLLTTIGYDFARGGLGESEHPFTTSISKDDHRVTTHIYANNIISNIYSVLHEGGHGIFGQSIEDLMYEKHIDHYRSLAMDESSSRFFENIIGRSREFISLIYPEFHRIFRAELKDVRETDLYFAVNRVNFEKIRVEADELTYSLHILIRYEIEKELVNNNLTTKGLNKLWNKLYKEYLGVKVENDKEGILQDVHWSSGFGYFPTYALGNAYNAMYFKKMKSELNFTQTILDNEIPTIVNWMKENVYKKASYLTSAEWIKDICGEELNPDAYIDYLIEKYSQIYSL